jgi:hypothetical protein
MTILSDAFLPFCLSCYICELVLIAQLEFIGLSVDLFPKKAVFITLRTWRTIASNTRSVGDANGGGVNSEQEDPSSSASDESTKLEQDVVATLK